MIKKIIIAFLMLIGTNTITHAKDLPVNIRVNDQYIKTVSEPFIENGVTYAPIRSVADALNCNEITWNDKAKTAYIEKNGKKITLDTSKKNIKLISDRVYIPVRYVAEIFDCDVEWDSQYSNVEINADNEAVSDDLILDEFSHDELFWLSRIIYAESGGEPFEGQVAVGHVILNRVKSNLFPNTIWGVIFDDRNAIQFEPVLNKSIYCNPSKDSIGAAKVALTSQSNVGECMYFFAPKLSPVNWISKNRTFYKAIENHVFYL